jgi:hypothetical protein
MKCAASDQPARIASRDQTTFGDLKIEQLKKMYNEKQE